MKTNEKIFFFPGHRFGYVSEEQIRQLGATDEIRMIAVYDPTWELVIILLKPHWPRQTTSAALSSASAIMRKLHPDWLADRSPRLT